MGRLKRNDFILISMFVGGVVGTIGFYLVFILSQLGYLRSGGDFSKVFTESIELFWCMSPILLPLFLSAGAVVGYILSKFST